MFDLDHAARSVRLSYRPEIPDVGCEMFTFNTEVSVGFGAGQRLESKVYVALLTVLDDPLLIATAFRVVEKFMRMGAVYTGVVVEGVVTPSVVKCTTEPYLEYMATFTGEPRLPDAALNIGGGGTEV